MARGKRRNRKVERSDGPCSNSGSETLEAIFKGDRWSVCRVGRVEEGEDEVRRRNGLVYLYSLFPTWAASTHTTIYQLQ